MKIDKIVDEINQKNAASINEVQDVIRVLDGEPLIREVGGVWLDRDGYLWHNIADDFENLEGPTDCVSEEVFHYQLGRNGHAESMGGGPLKWPLDLIEIRQKTQEADQRITDFYERRGKDYGPNAVPAARRKTGGVA
jgi:hypothetical protein